VGPGPSGPIVSNGDGIQSITNPNEEELRLKLIKELETERKKLEQEIKDEQRRIEKEMEEDRLRGFSSIPSSHFSYSLFIALRGD
jgi:hypothetical protein